MNMQLYYLVLPKTPMNIRISRLWSTKNEQNFSHGKSFKIPLNKNHQAERLSKVCTYTIAAFFAKPSDKNIVSWSLVVDAKS